MLENNIIIEGEKRMGLFDQLINQATNTIQANAKQGINAAVNKMDGRDTRKRIHL